MDIVGESVETLRAGSAEEDLRLRLVDEFAGFGPSYMKWVKSRLRDRGLTYARIRLIGALHCGGPQIMSSISEELGVTRRNVTFSPAGGTRVVALTRMPERAPAAQAAV